MADTKRRKLLKYSGRCALRVVWLIHMPNRNPALPSIFGTLIPKGAIITPMTALRVSAMLILPIGARPSQMRMGNFPSVLMFREPMAADRPISTILCGEGISTCSHLRSISKALMQVVVPRFQALVMTYVR